MKNKDKDYIGSTDLIANISETSGVDPQKAKMAYDVIIETMVNCLSHGDRVEFRRFGSFSVKKRTINQYRNPKTETIIRKPTTRYKACFKPGQPLCLRVNNK